MNSGYECLNCSLLGKCADTDEAKLKSQYYCAKWEGAVSELVNARNELIRNFGQAAFPALLILDSKDKEE